MLSKKAVQARAKKIKLLLMDVDGVMTTGDVIYMDDGTEIKIFDSQDGHGVRMAHRAGLKTGIITGRESEAVLHRARDLGVEIVYQRSFDKQRSLEDVIHVTGIQRKAIAFIGDDVTDIPIMRQVGLAVAVPNARPEVKRFAHYVTRAQGGRGAVREVIELILKANGKWKEVTEKYFR